MTPFTCSEPDGALPPEIPPAAPATLATSDAPLERTVSKKDRLAGLRLVAVDDDETIRELLQQALESAGAEVCTAASAREALEKIRRFHPHAIISDIGMPQEDGYAFLRLVRNLPPESGGATPAIAVSGFTKEKDRAAAREAGYQAFAAKPVDLRELIGLITRLAVRGAR